MQGSNSSRQMLPLQSRGGHTSASNIGSDEGFYAHHGRATPTPGQNPPQWDGTTIGSASYWPISTPGPDDPYYSEDDDPSSQIFQFDNAALARRLERSATYRPQSVTSPDFTYGAAGRAVLPYAPSPPPTTASTVRSDYGEGRTGRRRMSRSSMPVPQTPQSQARGLLRDLFALTERRLGSARGQSRSGKSNHRDALYEAAGILQQIRQISEPDSQLERWCDTKSRAISAHADSLRHTGKQRGHSHRNEERAYWENLHEDFESTLRQLGYEASTRLDSPGSHRARDLLPRHVNAERRRPGREPRPLSVELDPDTVIERRGGALPFTLRSNLPE